MNLNEYIDEIKTNLQENEREKLTINKIVNAISIKYANHVVFYVRDLKKIKRICLKLNSIDFVEIENINKLYKADVIDNNLIIETPKNDLDVIEVLNKLKPLIVRIICDLEKNLSVKMTFGCCSRYVECSNSLKCINPDSEFARGCLYRINLELGKIYYGKNKNID